MLFLSIVKAACQSAYFPQMNPTTRIWNIPPPPGTEEEELSNCSSKKDGSTHSGSRAIDRIDPYLKSKEYVEYERKYSAERSKYRSRSRSRSRGKYRRRVSGADPGIVTGDPDLDHAGDIGAGTARLKAAPDRPGTAITAVDTTKAPIFLQTF
ncbi:hypothetical protein NQ317_002978 [Molorchus minor]|uniref:Uncharacterized protein n=1 Tax=Molorchus minor TaxID=1323400 RepID=A0ABQ9J807_9CUCU|nr:hypothetical protein NQ317_002978 [Molorchus minor]